MKTECIGESVELKGKNFPCTVSLAMNLVGGKWKVLILYHLKEESRRYNELRKEMPSVTDMTLSLQLKQLEKDGLVSRKVYGKKPPVKVVYSLTDLGKSFVPVLEAITAWGNEIVSKNGKFISTL